jgi:hypothetical protein
LGGANPRDTRLLGFATACYVLLTILFTVFSLISIPIKRGSGIFTLALFDIFMRTGGKEGILASELPPV